jgi:hypothetical protein
MRRLALITTAITALVSSTLFAGPPDIKQVAPAPPPCEFGTGFYFGLDGGANVYQMFNDSFSRDFHNGDNITLHIDHNVGGYGGIKLGYVFGTGTFRPAIEEDMFYNGWQTGADSLLTINGVVTRSSGFAIRMSAWCPERRRITDTADRKKMRYTWTGACADGRGSDTIGLESGVDR